MLILFGMTFKKNDLLILVVLICLVGIIRAAYVVGKKDGIYVTIHGNFK